jgi:hypothetical protein
VADQERPNRGPWIIAGSALLVVTLVIGGFVWWQTNERACNRWREDARLLTDDLEQTQAPQLDGPAFEVLLRRVEALKERRPGGCPAPESPYREIFESES